MSNFFEAMRSTRRLLQDNIAGIKPDLPPVPGVERAGPPDLFEEFRRDFDSRLNDRVAMRSPFPSPQNTTPPGIAAPEFQPPIDPTAQIGQLDDPPRNLLDEMQREGREDREFEARLAEDRAQRQAERQARTGQVNSDERASRQAELRSTAKARREAVNTQLTARALQRRAKRLGREMSDDEAMLRAMNLRQAREGGETLTPQELNAAIMMADQQAGDAVAGLRRVNENVAQTAGGQFYRFDPDGSIAQVEYDREGEKWVPVGSTRAGLRADAEAGRNSDSVISNLGRETSDYLASMTRAMSDPNLGPQVGQELQPLMRIARDIRAIQGDANLSRPEKARLMSERAALLREGWGILQPHLHAAAMGPQQQMMQLEAMNRLAEARKNELEAATFERSLNVDIGEKYHKSTMDFMKVLLDARQQEGDPTAAEIEAIWQTASQVTNRAFGLAAPFEGPDLNAMSPTERRQYLDEQERLRHEEQERLRHQQRQLEFSSRGNPRGRPSFTF